MSGTEGEMEDVLWCHNFLTTFVALWHRVLPMKNHKQ